MIWSACRSRPGRSGWSVVGPVWAVALLALPAGPLWGASPRDELRTLQTQKADEVKGLQDKLKKTEEELQSERERRGRLEQALSQGKK